MCDENYYFMVSQGKQRAIKIKPLSPPLDPWQVTRAFCVFLTAVFQTWPLLLPGQQAVNNKQAFHQSTGALCLERLYTCLNRHDLSSWDTFFTVMAAL